MGRWLRMPVCRQQRQQQICSEGGLSRADAVSAADEAVRQALGDAARGRFAWQDGGALSQAAALFKAYFADGARAGGHAAQRQAAVLLLQAAMLPVWGGAALCRAGGSRDGAAARAFAGWLGDAFGWGAMDGEGFSLAGRAVPLAGAGGQKHGALSGPVFYPPFVKLTEAAFEAMGWAKEDGVFDAARFAQDMAAFWETACGLADAADGDAREAAEAADAFDAWEAEDDIPAFSRKGQAGGEQTFYQQDQAEEDGERGYTASANPSEAEQAEANRLEAKTDTEALMDLHKAENFVRSGKDVDTTVGMSVAAVTAIVDELAVTFRNAPEIIVTESPFDFSPDAMPDGMGLFDPGTGKCWLFSRNLRNAEDATATFSHEVIAHYGLRGFFGERLGDVLVAVRNHNPKVEMLSQIWWKNNQDYINQVRRQEGKNWTQDEFERWQRDIAIEEAMAQLAEKGERITGIKHLVVWIQRALRRLGWRWAKNLANWLESKTDAEALYALYKAELFVRGDISALTTVTKENLSTYRIDEDKNSGAE